MERLTASGGAASVFSLQILVGPGAVSLRCPHTQHSVWPCSGTDLPSLCSEKCILHSFCLLPGKACALGFSLGREPFVSLRCIPSSLLPTKSRWRNDIWPATHMTLGVFYLLVRRSKSCVLCSE